jgi:hypothetical protein
MAHAIAGRTQDKAQGERTSRGRWRPGVSGNPSGTTKSKRFLELNAGIMGDLGGEDRLSGVERIIVTQAVNLLIRSEKAKDGDTVVRLSNAATRLLASLRNTRRLRSHKPIVPLREQLAAEAERAG